MTYINSDRKQRAFKFVSVNWRDPMQMLSMVQTVHPKYGFLYLDVFKRSFDGDCAMTHYGTDSFIVLFWVLEGPMWKKLNR